MSRWNGAGGPRDDLAYGDLPERWDRDRFERLGGRGGGGGGGGVRYEEDYHYVERDRPGRRDVAVADHIESRAPPRPRFDDDRSAFSARPRRRTDRELFGDVDPLQYAGMELAPYRARSISRHDDRDGPGAAPPRPGIIRRQSSLDTFDRRPTRRAYDREDEYQIKPYTPVPLPFRTADRLREDDYRDTSRRRHYNDGPDEYREVEIQRERSVHRRRARTVRSSSSSSDASVTTIARPPKLKKGKTRMPKRLVHRDAIIDLNYPFEEEEGFFVLKVALGKEQINEVISLSEPYKRGEKKIVYKYEATDDAAVDVPAQEHEEILRTEWINPPSVAGSHHHHGASTPRAASPARTVRSTRTRGRSPPASFEQNTKVVIEDHTPVQVPPPPAAPIAPQYVDSRHYQANTTTTLVVPDRDIQTNTALLEAESRALRLERETTELRARSPTRSRSRSIAQPLVLADPPAHEVLRLYDRERSSSRAKSPVRNVVRVEKDRKGRMALVRSSH